MRLWCVKVAGHTRRADHRGRAVVVPWSDSGFGKERTLAFYRRQFAGTPDVRFVDIADSGHFVMLDQPKAFADALGMFVR